MLLNSLSTVLLLLVCSNSLGHSLLTHCSSPSLIMYIALNLAYSPNFTQTIYSAVLLWVLPSTFDQWQHGLFPEVQWPFPFTSPPKWLCTLLPQQCLLCELISHHEVHPPLNCLYSRKLTCLISLGAKLLESSNPVYKTIASHAAPVNFLHTVHSGQVFSKILSVEYGSAGHVGNVCSRVVWLFWDVLET